MKTYGLIESDSPLLTIPLSGCSKDLNRKELKENLTETMENFTGIGLSANQCGIMERAFVMYSDVKKKEIIACFNPKIISESEEKIFMDEGCLTYPGLWIKVKRPEGIEVTYEDENGKGKWSAFAICEALSEKRGYTLSRGGGAPDVHRAGLEIIRDCVDGIVCLCFHP